MPECRISLWPFSQAAVINTSLITGGKQRIVPFVEKRNFLESFTKKPAICGLPPHDALHAPFDDLRPKTFCVITWRIY